MASHSDKEFHVGEMVKVIDGSLTGTVYKAEAMVTGFSDHTVYYVRIRFVSPKKAVDRFPAEYNFGPWQLESIGGGTPSWEV